jgi:hypothetical protein
MPVKLVLVSHTTEKYPKSYSIRESSIPNLMWLKSIFFFLGREKHPIPCEENVSWSHEKESILGPMRGKSLDKKLLIALEEAPTLHKWIQERFYT